ncbi:MAG TPA: hypothetical protein VFV70_04390 [Hyphomonadaceae bacterium]|nr:hypothetical protein [Hyphomonadaceae bacterium]
MSVRRLSKLAVIAVALAAPSHGQVSSAPLAKVDTWGVGWLTRAESTPSDIWANTTTEAIAPLFAAMAPQQLSPATRAALRRIMLSASKGPDDANGLVAERLRLLEQLGEAERALDLRKRFADQPWGAEYERRASDFDLVNDRKDSACGRTAGKRPDDAAWMPVRAFCLALSGDMDGATLIGENLPPAADGQPGAWLLGAISAMDPAVKTKPEGRYDNAFDAAVSVAAKLSAPPSAFAGMPSDVAAAIVLHPGATNEQKRGALRAAIDSPRVKASNVVEILLVKDETPAAKPARGSQTAPDFLSLAITAAGSAEAGPDAKSAAVAAALKGAEGQSDFRIAAMALSEAIKALPRGPANAETFARAALATGDTKAASEWRKEMDEAADPWAAARTDLMLSYAGVNAGKTSQILDRLVAAIPPAPESTATAARTAAATPAARQLDLRRIENTRVMFLLAGTGRNLSPEQRALLFEQKAAGRGVSDAAIARIASAVDQKADGEAAMAALSLMGSDTSALSFAGLADLLALLRKAGFEKEADAIALESLQVWKAL